MTDIIYIKDYDDNHMTICANTKEIFCIILYGYSQFSIGYTYGAKFWQSNFYNSEVFANFYEYIDDMERPNTN